MPMKFYTPAPLAALYVNGQMVFRGSWAMAQYKRKAYQDKPGVELHKAPHLKGIAYCQKYQCATKDPYITPYEGTHYWKCTCNHINFLACIGN